jgi:hypothetical protein
LPVALKSGKDLLVSGAAQNGNGHGAYLALRITDRVALRLRNIPQRIGSLCQSAADSRIVLCGLGKADFKGAERTPKRTPAGRDKKPPLKAAHEREKHRRESPTKNHRSRIANTGKAGSTVYGR